MNLDATQKSYLRAMGVDFFYLRNQPGIENKDGIVNCNTEKAPVIESDAWKSLRSQVSTCTKCALHRGRTQTVFGVGDINADWLLIGEAPGAEEDKQGEPFVGRAGKLLTNMLFAMGLRREQVFIANILKCRPPNNRDPRMEEVIECEHYLKKQINLIKPRIIIALGRVAAQNLLKVETPIGKMRGQRYEYPDPVTPVIVTYHPAYLLRSPREKRKSWQDLQLAMKVFEETA